MANITRVGLLVPNAGFGLLPLPRKMIEVLGRYSTSEGSAPAAAPASGAAVDGGLTARPWLLLDPNFHRRVVAVGLGAGVRNANSRANLCRRLRRHRVGNGIRLIETQPRRMLRKVQEYNNPEPWH
jgi:hypothetical protein